MTFSVSAGEVEAPAETLHAIYFNRSDVSGSYLPRFSADLRKETDLGSISRWREVTLAEPVATPPSCLALIHNRIGN